VNFAPYAGQPVIIYPHQQQQQQQQWQPNQPAVLPNAPQAHQLTGLQTLSFCMLLQPIL